MILSFTQKINGKPNYFIEKIWLAIAIINQALANANRSDYRALHKEKFGVYWESPPLDKEVKPKLHTIRMFRKTKDGKRAEKQWKAGDTIHPGINNRSPDYFQFAPAIKCTGIQTIIIGWEGSNVVVTIDGMPFFVQTENDNRIGEQMMLQLAINDGFESIEDFFTYFNEDFNGVIIHWSDIRYSI